MATKKTEAAEPHDDDKCANCGACKHCGNGGVKFVPYPVPYVVQPQPAPRPYTNPFPYRPWYGPSCGTTPGQDANTVPHVQYTSWNNASCNGTYAA